MSELPHAIVSHIAQVWAGRMAEEPSANAIRLARWQVRADRDPVAVPPNREIAWLSVANIQSINHKTRGIT